MGKTGLSLLQKAIVALLVVQLPVLITFLVTYTSLKEHLLSLVLKDITIIRDVMDNQIKFVVKDIERHTQEIAHEPTITELLRKATKDRSVAERLSQYVADHWKGVYIVAPDGRIIAPAVEGGTDIAVPLNKVDALKNGTTIITRRTEEGKPLLYAMAPIRAGEEEQPTGFVVKRLYIDELGIIPITTAISQYESIKIYLVDRAGNLIASTVELKGGLKGAPPVEECIRYGRSYEGRYQSASGREIFATSSCIIPPVWAFVVEVDMADVWRPINMIKKGVVLTAMVVGLIMVVLFVVFSRTVMRNLRRLVTFADNISRGNYDVTLPVETSDEIGQLTERFNMMAREIKQRTQEITESRRTLSTLLSNLPGMAYRALSDRERTLEFISNGSIELTGYTPQEFLSGKVRYGTDIIHPDDREQVYREINDAIEGLRPYKLSYRIITRDGTERWVWEQGRMVGSRDDVAILEGFVADMTEQKRAELELKKLSSAIEESINIVFITDTEGRIEYVNPTFERVTGYTKQEVIGKTPRILSSGETSPYKYRELWLTIKSGKTWRGIFKNRKKNGEYYWANGLVYPVKDETGRITHFIAIQEDITERMLVEERMRYLSTHDGLTGLYNRDYFIELLGEWIGAARREGKKGGLLLLGLDQFKLINDTYGHGMGDEVLRSIARLIEACVRYMDDTYPRKAAKESIIARLGGDEFAIFIPYLNAQEIMEIAEKMRKMIEEFKLMGRNFYLTASIGIALYPEQGTTIKELITKADAALSHAKEKGRNRCEFFSEEYRILEDMHERLKWKRIIFDALEKDRIELWFQPILHIKTNRIYHYEVLARMRDEKGELIFPGVFIDIAERFGLIDALNRMIVEKAIRLQAEMNRKNSPITISINLSGLTLGDESSLTFISDTIKKVGANPDHLVFEITETAAVEDIEMAKRFINILKKTGCHFSLDDFGVGFTSFMYLRELSVDYIKIDGSFVRRLKENKNDQLVVQAISHIARGMNIKTIAEFVENEESLELLKEFGIDYAQGYYIGKPSPSINFEEREFVKE